MGTKIKKGVEVWSICGYDRKATVSIARLTIQSFGKTQGTATKKQSGKFIKCRLYAPYDSLYPVADVVDVEALALQLAREYKEQNIAHYRNTQHVYADTTTPHYHESMRRDCEAVMAATPSFIYRDA